MWRLFASAEGPHIAIAPEKIIEIGNVELTNSNIYAWVSALLIGWLVLWTARQIAVKPKGGVVQFVEMGADFVTGLLASSMGSRAKAVKYAPLFATIFFFVLLNNWLGLAPGVGPALYITNDHGGETPIFRPFTADLNGTIALALISIVIVQYVAIKEMGGLNHLRHYFGGNFKNPINIFVGILEMFGELTRVISLSLRLFFNVLIGEILISIFSYLGKVASPITTLPFIGMELFVGFVQAYIFTMLCATYLGIATSHSHDDDHHSDTGTSHAAEALEGSKG